MSTTITKESMNEFRSWLGPVKIYAQNYLQAPAE